jgi:hypothetical protein
MKVVRKRLTYANIMSTIGLFLLLAGGTAVAAKQLGKKTVGPKQLKSNAVTTKKIRKAAVTRAKIKNAAVDNTKIADNAVSGAKIADGSVTGGDINAASTPFSQITTRLRTNATVPFGGAPTPYALGSYTQSVGNDDQYVGGLEVTFASSCGQPRLAQAYLLLDASNPVAPAIGDLIGVATVQDAGAGTVTHRADFGPFPGASPMSRMSPLSNTPHTFTVLLVTGACSSGSGIGASGALLDVISTK